jgi:hypothetical protein
MELEEALKKIEDLQKQVEAEARAKKEILGEKKQLQAKYETIDPNEYVALQGKVEELTKALEETQTLSKTQLEQLTNELNVKSGALESVMIDKGITEALMKAEVMPELMDGAKALLIRQAKLVNDNGEFKALLGDKPLTDAVNEWATGDQGKYFVKAKDNTGSSAVLAGQNGDTGKSDANKAAKLAEAKNSGDIHAYLAASLTS